MKTHPLALPDFQARAAHEGRLRQHREVLLPQDVDRMRKEIGMWLEFKPGTPFPGHPSLPYAPGDKLWVRENLNGIGLPDGRRKGIMRYSADGEMVLTGEAGEGYSDVLWSYKGDHLNAHAMPRWASRTTLIIRAVRIERLQEISEEDARAEGCETLYAPGWDGDEGIVYYAREEYRDHWNATHKPGEQWEDNPWVIVREIEKETTDD